MEAGWRQFFGEAGQFKSRWVAYVAASKRNKKIKLKDPRYAPGLGNKKSMKIEAWKKFIFEISNEIKVHPITKLLSHSADWQAFAKSPPFDSLPSSKKSEATFFASIDAKSWLAEWHKDKPYLALFAIAFRSKFCKSLIGQDFKVSSKWFSIKQGNICNWLPKLNIF